MEVDLHGFDGGAIHSAREIEQWDQGPPEASFADLEGETINRS
jgi:hypothetical protein